MANDMDGDGARAWMYRPLTRYGFGQVGVGLGFLAVVAVKERSLDSPFAFGFGSVGLLSLVVGGLLIARGWGKGRRA